MKTLADRSCYSDLEIGASVEVKQYYDGVILEEKYRGKITNMDGQNIVVKLSSGKYIACNPKYAEVRKRVGS